MRSSRFRQDSVDGLVYRRSLRLKIQQEHFWIIGNCTQIPPTREIIFCVHFERQSPQLANLRLAPIIELKRISQVDNSLIMFDVVRDKDPAIRNRGGGDGRVLSANL